MKGLGISARLTIIIFCIICDMNISYYYCDAAFLSFFQASRSKQTANAPAPARLDFSQDHLAAGVKRSVDSFKPLFVLSKSEMKEMGLVNIHASIISTINPRLTFRKTILQPE